jgi:U32 family peptidase
VKAGVKSFKIEGRLKSPEYVSAVTRVYRKALDAAIAETESPVTASDRYALEMTFSRGLSTGWFAGTNHPYLTHGKFGKKRGPLLGEIVDCAPGWIRLGNLTGVPFAAGDGVVFDAGENRDLEQGARIWKVEGDRLVFHLTYSGINFDRIQPGHTVYKTSDPKLDSELRRFWQNTRPAEKKTPLDLVVSGRPGEPMEIRAGAFAVRSEIPLQEAAKHPVSTEKLAEQLGRLGDSPFELGSLDNRLEGDCHIAVSVLNQLRRSLVKQLETASGEKPARPPVTVTYRDLLPAPEPVITPAEPKLSVLCRTMDQLTTAIECGVETIYCDF